MINYLSEILKNFFITVENIRVLVKEDNYKGIYLYSNKKDFRWIGNVHNYVDVLDRTVKSVGVNGHRNLPIYKNQNENLCKTLS